MILRNATIQDASQLIILLKQMGYKMDLPAMQDRILAFNKIGHQIIVAEQDKVIIAAIAFACYEQFRLAGSCCHVDTLIIDSHYRRTGIGKKLMGLAEKYANEHGANCVELITANRRRSEGTHAFYQSLGYKDHVFLDYSYFAKENLGL